MRKKTKALKLSRETLRNLQAPALRRAVGGGETFEILTTCACTDTCGTDNSCNACTSTCGCGSNTCTQEIMTTCVC